MGMLGCKAVPVKESHYDQKSSEPVQNLGSALGHSSRMNRLLGSIERILRNESWLKS
uniref:Uncharacterized protein n=1 Tax=Candidatus Kentrum sp. LPFa TaxID=2126335 RepID=A0A450X7N0_9GAMM|nr:MAG: hypothetical protein BECKLPF1236A_GA0070988_104632 [Candidatus Kentron sp. LPFa]